MSSTPRKSSIRSSRFPTSLRLPASNRATSNPHVSLVFAHADPSPSSMTSNQQRPSNNPSRSEELLSKQLDGDTGGRQMGLRSRTGSSATIKTVKSLRRSSLGEEVEEEEPGFTEGGVHSGIEEAVLAEDGRRGEEEADVGTIRKLNQKASTSWLRWNATTSSIPKSQVSSTTDKGKGKEGVEGAEPERPPLPAQEPFPADDPTSQSQTVLDEEARRVDSDHPPTSEPTSQATVRGGWWYRNPPPPVPTSVAVQSSKPPVGFGSVPVHVEAKATDGSDAVLGMAPSARLPETAMTIQPMSEPDPATTEPLRERQGTIKSQNTATWGGYLTWRSKQGTPTVTGDTGSAVTVETGSTAHGEGNTLPEAGPQNKATASDSAPLMDPLNIPAVIPPVAPQMPVETLHQPGWGSYLYSFVGRQSTDPTVPGRAEADLTTADIRPDLPTAESPAQSTPQITHLQINVDPATPSPLTTNQDQTPAPLLVPPPDHTQPIANTSWTSYLAFRAAQKKVGPPLEKGARKSEDTGEEVMDLSNDPEFTKIADTIPADATLPVTKPTPNLAIAKKRLSISSTRSAGSSKNISSSPKPEGQASSSSTPSITPRTTNSSSLPPPPQVPAVQPNLVIPTFETTFHRPPRSLPPLAPPVPIASNPGMRGKAWNAISMAGSYVYGSGSSTQKEGESKVEEGEKEMRGLKEGRSVGADLPRWSGMGGGREEEGWKDVKRVVVVGVHGWFPAKMLNSVIGEPTGTSQKFANMMGQAVRKFFQERGVDDGDLRLTLMPLEGEGTIEHRVDRLYKSYLSNPAWINDLRRADLIFFAAHSQGCIVTTHLISRLIAQGHIRTANNRDAVSRCEWAFGPVGIIPSSSPTTSSGSSGGFQKVGFLAMCGVHLGPFSSINTSSVIGPYLQWFENAAARELFEFGEWGSGVTEEYRKALGEILDGGVRVVMLASLNDQVVPIYGASFTTASHPLLLRALFVDGASYSASDFMTNLLCFAFMLRNAGISDGGLVEHLSEATAGSLTGVGHSTPYEDPQSYDLLVNYLIRSSPVDGKPLPALSVEPFSAKDVRNDFELPWIMRSLVDSKEIQDLFPGELRELKEGVLGWKPATRALRDIKKRLEPMAGRQSKLRSISNSESSTTLSDTASSAIVRSPKSEVMAKGKMTAVQPSALRKDW